MSEATHHRTRIKQLKRAERERELAARQCALPDRRYGAIDRRRHSNRYHTRRLERSGHRSGLEHLAVNTPHPPRRRNKCAAKPVRERSKTMSKMGERALKAQEEKEREMQNDSKQQQVTSVDTQLPANWEEAAARVLKAASEGPMAFMKFKKGHYFNGEREVPLKTKYLAYCDAWACGWTNFIDGQPVKRNFVVVATVAENKVPDRRDRDGLGDLDKSKWSKDENGEPSDPWVFRHLLPLEDIETGERLLFATPSIGGEIGVKLLCKKWARNAQLGLPTIELAVGTYDTKKYRDIPRPDFRVTKWERGSTAEPVDVAPRPQPYSEPEEPPLEVYDADLELEIGR